MYIDTELVLPMYNVYPCFTSKVWTKKCPLCTTTYSTLFNLFTPAGLPLPPHRPLSEGVGSPSSAGWAAAPFSSW